MQTCVEKLILSPEFWQKLFWTTVFFIWSYWINIAHCTSCTYSRSKIRWRHEWVREMTPSWSRNDNAVQAWYGNTCRPSADLATCYKFIPVRPRNIIFTQLCVLKCSHYKKLLQHFQNNEDTISQQKKSLPTLNRTCQQPASSWVTTKTTLSSYSLPQH